MSRLVLACSLIAALSTSAAARRLVTPDPQFAQPPISDGMPSEAQAPMPDPNMYQLQPPVLDRAAVRAKLAANRAANLVRFRAYQQAGVFPSNTFDDRKLNVWIDAEGHLCAAATIINASGLGDLVQRVGAQSNFIRLADVRQGPLMDWILTSGLTQAEIAMIQEPFMPVYRERPAPVITVDAKLRAKETARLRAKYKQVDAKIVKAQKRSLDAATDRLMRRPDLARSLLQS